jgi:hypothetical protein
VPPRPHHYSDVLLVSISDVPPFPISSVMPFDTDERVGTHSQPCGSAAPLLNAQTQNIHFEDLD